MKKAKNKPLEGGFSFSGTMYLRGSLVDDLTEQDKLEKYVLESIYGRHQQPQRVTEQAHTWRLWCEVQADVQWWQDELASHPVIELVEVIQHGKSWFEGIFRFTQPPRIVYGDESAEIARLRAAGVALVKEAVVWDEFSVGWRCIGCGAFHDIFEQVEHTAECKTRVFAEGGE